MNDILNPKNLPAHLAGKKSELSARLEKTLRGGNRLSIRGKQWRLSFGGDEIPSNDNHLDVVIVNAPEKAGRVYYPTSYKGSGENTGPVCWSDNSDTPDPALPHPQAPSCMECPQNVKGSARDGNGRACRFHKRIAVAIAGSLDGGLFQLQLPATSVFGRGTGTKLPFDAYIKTILANGLSPDWLVTRMEFDQEAEGPKVIFRPLAHLNEQEIETIHRAASTVDAQQMVVTSYPIPDSEEESSTGFAGFSATATATPSHEEPAEAQAPAPQEPVVKSDPTPIPEASGDLARILKNFSNASESHLDDE